MKCFIIVVVIAFSFGDVVAGAAQAHANSVGIAAVVVVVAATAATAAGDDDVDDIDGVPTPVDCRC